METLLGLLFLVLFALLIIGLVRPNIVLKWSKKPTRLKVVGWYFLLTIIVGILFSVLNTNENGSGNTSSKISSALKKIENKKYESAITELKKINSSDSLYASAQQLIIKADSLRKVDEAESKLLEEELENKKKAESELLSKKQAEEELSKQKEQLEREINSINKGVDFSTYRGSIESMQYELVMFSTWAKIIDDAESTENSELKNLASQLKTKVASLQIKEFPLLRKEYTKIAAKIMWEYDITVTVDGTGNKYINFTGGLFAANKNKQDFQDKLSEILRMFRFSQSRYRWYNGEDTYAYYTIFEGKDSDLVSFSK